MKTSAKILVGALAAVISACGYAQATPRSAEALGSNYFISTEDLDGFHVGGYYRYNSREMMNGFDELSQDTIAAIIGYDILDWASIYAILGTTDAERTHGTNNREYGTVYGIGSWINILDRDIVADLSCESRFTIAATAQITAGSPSLDGTEIDYTDFYGAITLGIVNELIGDKSLWPEAIGIFVGPCWDVFDSDQVKTTGEDFGVAFGLDVFLTKRISMSASYETYGGKDDAVNFSFGCRF